MLLHAFSVYCLQWQNIGAKYEFVLTVLHFLSPCYWFSRRYMSSPLSLLILLLLAKVLGVPFIGML